jgi:hypothetical protein
LLPVSEFPIRRIIRRRLRRTDRRKRKAPLAGDVRKLYEWGTHPFLLAHTTRWGLFGLNPALYAERIQGARDPQ